MVMARKAEYENGGGRSVVMPLLRLFTLFVLVPVILLMNTCGLVFSEQRDAASSGMLTAKVILVNPGAMSEYSGGVWVLPRYVPPIWPLDAILGCRALDFASDPQIEVEWEETILVVEHDPFFVPATRKERCYGRAIMLKERLP